MTATQWIGIALLQIGLLLLLGLAGARLAGRLRVAPLAGAVLAGMLLGPTVLGRLAPDAHRYLITGGHEAHHRLQQHLDQRQADRQRLLATGVSEAALAEFDAQTWQRAAQLRAQIQRDESRYRPVRRFPVLIAVCLALFTAGLHSGHRDQSRRAGMLSRAAPLALGAFLMPAALAALAGWALIESQWVDLGELPPLLWSAGLVLGCAAAGAPPATPATKTIETDTPISQGPHDRSSSEAALTASAAMLNAAGALAAASALLLYGLGRDHTADRIASLPLAAAPLAFFAALLLRPLLRRSSDRWRRALPAIFNPLLFAIAGSRVDLIGHFDWLLVLLVLITFDDGKALGAAFAARWFGRLDWPHALRLGLVFANAAPVPLAIALLLYAAAAIDGPLYTALVLASVLSALLNPLSIRMIEQIGPVPPHG